VGEVPGRTKGITGCVPHAEALSLRAPRWDSNRTQNLAHTGRTLGAVPGSSSSSSSSSTLRSTLPVSPQALELEAVPGLGAGEVGVGVAALQHHQGLRVDVGQPVLVNVGVLALEQRVVDARLRR